MSEAGHFSVGGIFASTVAAKLLQARKELIYNDY